MAQNTDIDDLFATARSAPAVPTDELMARIIADAARLQPRKAVPAPVTKPGFWAAVSALFGGGGALAGMGTATVAGLYLGFAQPVSVANLTEALLTGSTLDSVELMPGFDTLLSEE